MNVDGLCKFACSLTYCRRASTPASSPTRVSSGPRGGTDLVPDNNKKFSSVFSTVADAVLSFKPPKEIKKGSGGKSTDGGRNKCRIPASRPTQRLQATKNTLPMQLCVNDKTLKDELFRSWQRMVWQSRLTQTLAAASVGSRLEVMYSKGAGRSAK
ncbi:hypothetical protein CPLU01_06473 [Colletotrichum plurivorum]|uniref:Uncharacterized protein n=1 Tax=Colletotrichum plurivorum TaxID=2175906 RepID=A0A8H6KJJ5_9PEZI|nr:hypothetical protein CPLU01_06473 [Colletotrichum plurivorum]